MDKQFNFREYCEFERLDIVLLYVAIEAGMTFVYGNMVIYDPRDFSYWGA